MSDFEGEGVLSDEEIVTLSRSMTAAHDHLGTHAMPSSPRRIPGVAAIYQKHRLHAAVNSAQGWLPLWLGIRLWHQTLYRYDTKLKLIKERNKLLQGTKTV